MPFDEEELDPHGECAAEIKKLRELVHSAYSEGFGEGRREFTTSRGGAPWSESKAKAALDQ